MATGDAGPSRRIVLTWDDDERFLRGLEELRARGRSIVLVDFGTLSVEVEITGEDLRVREPFWARLGVVATRLLP